MHCGFLGQVLTIGIFDGTFTRIELRDLDGLKHSEADNQGLQQAFWLNTSSSSLKLAGGILRASSALAMKMFACPGKLKST